MFDPAYRGEGTEEGLEGCIHSANARNAAVRGLEEARTNSALEPSKIQKMVEESKSFFPVQFPFLKAASVTGFLCISPEIIDAHTSKIGIYVFFPSLFTHVVTGTLSVPCFSRFFTNNDS